MAKLSFDIFKCPGPARTSVWVLLHSGELAGRIITAWPNDGAGRVRMAVSIYGGPLKQDEILFGQAGGYGYDKESAAFQDALERHGIVVGRDLSGRGMGAVRDWFASKGYDLVQVL